MSDEHDDEQALISCGSSTGPFVMKMHREWSPHGYDRAVELFERGFYDNSHFFRVVPKFLVQFGITYSDDQELKKFARQTIPDDPKKNSHFRPGLISFAGNGNNSRTSQLFISYGSAPSLGREKWETPIGEVIEGMENVDKFYSYGEMPPWGKGPQQGKIHGGPAYIEENFPKSDHFEACEVQRLTPGSGGGDGVAETEEKAPDAKLDHDLLQTNVRKRIGHKIKQLEEKSKTAYEENGDQMILIAILAIGMIVFVSIRNRRKVMSKTS